MGVPSGSMKLIITSPPYNLGKVYEHATELEDYLENLTPVVDQLIRVLASVVRHTDGHLFNTARARVTFSRMSVALAVQMKGLGF